MPGREIPSDGAGKGEGAFQLTTCLVLAPKASGAGMLSVGTGQTVPPSRDSLPQALDPLWSQVPVTHHNPGREGSATMSTPPCPAALASATPLQGSLPREPQPSPWTLRVYVQLCPRDRKRK